MEGSGDRLHVGCGQVDARGFVNIDVFPYPHVHYLRDIASRRLWAEGKAELVYASHALEHVPYEKVPAVLHNLHRILKVGGVLRLSVPDFDALVQIYELSDGDVSLIQPALMGGQDSQYNFHYAVFNRAYLKVQLKDAGFSIVREWHPDEWKERTWSDWASYAKTINGKQISVSLNMEAVK
jgi:predicted SAM-dependent methyltransferase